MEQVKADGSVSTLLRTPRALPKDPVAEHIVLWHIFRTPAQALRYSESVLLGDGQRLIGGHTRDSVGEIYWLGVHVDDLAKWGNTKAIQLSDPFDSSDPNSHGRPFD